MDDIISALTYPAVDLNNSGEVKPTINICSPTHPFS